MPRFALAIAFTCLSIPAHGQNAQSSSAVGCGLAASPPSAVDVAAIMRACTSQIETRGATSHQVSEALAVRAEIYRRQRDFSRALADYGQWVRLEPDSARPYYDRGITYALMQDDDKAIADFDRAIRAESNFVLAYNARGRAYSRRGNQTRAIADFDEAIRLNPSDVWVYVNRGTAYGRSGDFARSIADYDEALRRDSGFAPAYYNRGFTNAQLNNHAVALADFRAANRLAPHNPEILNGLCRSLALSGGDLTEARNACDAAILTRPDDFLFLSNRGLVGLKQSRFQDAWNDFNASVQRNNADMTARYGRGIAALRLGRERQGQADLDAALSRDPNIARTFAGFGITP